MIYVHKKCGQEVFVKSIVHEYAPLLDIHGSCIEAGDVMDSVIEESVIFCDECGETVSAQDVEDEENDKG